MPNPWSLQHEALSMQMYAEHMLHRNQEHHHFKGTASSSACLTESARRPCAPHLASGGSMHSVSSVADLQALAGGCSGMVLRGDSGTW